MIPWTTTPTTFWDANQTKAWWRIFQHPKWQISKIFVKGQSQEGENCVNWEIQSQKEVKSWRKLRLKILDCRGPLLVFLAVHLDPKQKNRVVPPCHIFQTQRLVAFLKIQPAPKCCQACHLGTVLITFIDWRPRQDRFLLPLLYNLGPQYEKNKWRRLQQDKG